MNQPNLHVENEQLKAMIEIMKQEMTQALSQVKGADPHSNLLLQREIIAKERKSFDLERQLRSREDDLRKLRAERERLIDISSELKAELNKVKRAGNVG
jgi:predicted RNase H-like nuclease (RuvC/YqgF family)